MTTATGWNFGSAILADQSPAAKSAEAATKAAREAFWAEQIDQQKTIVPTPANFKPRWGKRKESDHG
jgi:hypothetical protein